ncbi:MAG TPA: D-alanine--D-alanine ligase [Gemmataceae bacterium]|jgi:D-alanine-D-alanine ligase|nr:D-alanine--D-alanine ligase [Gemmataceae bacterium]
MKIGIAFDLKPKSPLPPGAPDDLHEEFDSPVTIRAIADVIRSMGHEPVELGNGKDLLRKLLDDPPDLVFNLAEGSGTSRNREARVPAVCEMLGIPHTGSDVLTLALCLDKDMCRRVVREADIRIPDGLFITFDDEGYDGDYHEFPGMVTESGLNVPLIAKPVCEGSSKGIRSKCLIERLEDVGPTVVSLWQDYKQGILLEEFISGEEVTVGILGNDPPRVIGCMQVVPKQDPSRFVYSLEVKRDWEDKIYYETPPKMPPDQIRALEEAALAAYDVLGIRDIARIDFRFKDGVPYFLEANPLPGLNPEWSDLILLAKAVRSSHTELVRTVITEAIQRAGLDC